MRDHAVVGVDAFGCWLAVMEDERRERRWIVNYGRIMESDESILHHIASLREDSRSRLTLIHRSFLGALITYTKCFIICYQCAYPS